MTPIETLGLGAEARIYSSSFLKRDVICKERLEKKFRLKAIDDKLRKERTVQEVRLLNNARMSGVNVPLVYDVDKASWTIVMEKIAGSPIKQFIPSENQDDLFQQIGTQVGQLHNMDIIHGDLTTSNIIVDNSQQVWFIDFGLGYISPQIEDKAVDILVLKHTLESSHPEEFQQLFTSFINAYSASYSQSKSVKKRMETVEMRVRYKSH